MKLEQQEISALKTLLSISKNRADESLDNLYNKILSNGEITLFIDGAADLNSKNSWNWWCHF